MNIAIIPARGGSKRIPGKNIKKFHGKPIICYSIEAALSCKEIFDKVIVTTDSKEIANIAENAGAEIPFLRPARFADDHTTTADVIMHAIEESEKIFDSRIDNACCIYATAPFIKTSDIRKGFELLMKNGVSSVFSVTTFPFPIFRAQKINESGNLEMVWPEYEFTRSNDLPETYHDAGQFYWIEARKFLVEKKIYTKDSLPVILPRIQVQDIDNTEDWQTAEILYQFCKKKRLF